MRKLLVRGRATRVARPTLLLCALVGSLFLSACSGDESSEATAPPAEAAQPAGETPHALANASDTPQATANVEVAASSKVVTKTKQAEKAPRHSNERPVPNFDGRTLAGTSLSMKSMLGDRVVLFFFDPSDPKSAPVARAVQALHEKAADNNFKVVGVGRGDSTAAIATFRRSNQLGFPVIDDSSGAIARKLRLQVPLAILGVDADGYVTFGLSYFPAPQDAEASTKELLADSMRVSLDETIGGELYAWPEAPSLGATNLDDGTKIETEALRGKAAIVIFFLHTCPHCHKALESIKGILEGMPQAQRPALVAISVQNAPTAIRRSMAELGLDFFTPYVDPNGEAVDAWGVTGGVPVVNVVDAEGRIRHRSQGWNEKRDGAMLRMQVARASGTRVPMILDPKGYSGNNVCGTCHEQEYATWQFTSHATAFDTLVTHEADRRKDCVGCHVIGYEEPGGYDFYRRPAHLENVGCESCHGRGGPHLSPNFVPMKEGTRDYAQVCGTCHNETHSLGFEFETFHPRVSHDRIAALSNAERAELLEGGPARDLLPTTADYVGSNACQSCHEAEFATWEKSPHGHAVATLEGKDSAGSPDCLACHTTAYGKAGGFVPDVPHADQPDLARVGCESCHGPGGDHIGENAKRVGTILSLGDKCDSCVILKVCGTCHDDENDPGFKFKVEERIEAQRHGTIESAATKAGLSAFHLPADERFVEGDLATHDRMLLRHAFDHVDAAATPASDERG